MADEHHHDHGHDHGGGGQNPGTRTASLPTRTPGKLSIALALILGFMCAELGLNGHRASNASGIKRAQRTPAIGEGRLT